MAHGITLTLREIEPSAPEHIHEHAPAVKVIGGYAKPKGLMPYVNPARDKKRHARLRAELRGDR